MSRGWVVGAVFVLLLACKPKSYTPSDDGDDGGSGDDDGGACTCQVPTTAGPLGIACGGSACDGTTAYICSPEGTTVPGPAGACGGVTDASYLEEGECVPSCAGTCGGSDGCGGTCGCAGGVPCNPNGTCGNGCALGVGEACLTVDAGASNCCSSGYVCQPGDAGGSLCCAPNMDGECAQDTDCCDYPAAHCQAVGDAGTHRCEP